MGNLSYSENKESLIHGMPRLLGHIGLSPLFFFLLLTPQFLSFFQRSAGKKEE